MAFGGNQLVKLAGFLLRKSVRGGLARKNLTNGVLFGRKVEGKTRLGDDRPQCKSRYSYLAANRRIIYMCSAA